MVFLPIPDDVQPPIHSKNETSNYEEPDEFAQECFCYMSTEVLQVDTKLPSVKDVDAQSRPAHACESLINKDLVHDEDTLLPRVSGRFYQPLKFPEGKINIPGYSNAKIVPKAFRCGATKC